MPLVTEGLNWDLARALNGAAGQYPILDGAARVVATDLVFLTFLSVVIWWFVPPGNEKGKRAALAAALALVCGQILNLAIGQLVFVPRPFVVHQVHLLVAAAADSSFPSDHATAAFCVAGTALVRGIRGKWLLVVGATLIAIARVYVGAHYPLDVIVGAAFGLAWSILFLRLDPWLAYPYELTIGVARRLRLA